MPLRVGGRQRGLRFAHAASSCQLVFKAHNDLFGFPLRSLRISAASALTSLLTQRTLRYAENAESGSSTLNCILSVETGRDRLLCLITHRFALLSLYVC